jgi:hypothetical protein
MKGSNYRRNLEQKFLAGISTKSLAEALERSINCALIMSRLQDEVMSLQMQLHERSSHEPEKTNPAPLQDHQPG